jgi:hypothetical protein
MRLEVLGMADEQQGTRGEPHGSEPRGFGEHTRGLPGEYAHEQGWGLAEEERKRQAAPPTDTDGGNDYNYSAQDFGDDPVNMARVGSDGEREEEAARRALGLKQQKENR